MTTETRIPCAGCGTPVKPLWIFTVHGKSLCYQCAIVVLDSAKQDDADAMVRLAGATIEGSPVPSLARREGGRADG